MIDHLPDGLENSRVRLTRMEDSRTVLAAKIGRFSSELRPIRHGAEIALTAAMALILHRSTRQVVLALVASLAISLSADAQTRIDPDRNSFSPAQDVELGRRAAAEVRREMPIARDGRTQDYVERIGERLVASIPGRLQQPRFQYSFQVVDRRDINAFALPGGPVFVNRGMLDAARNEGEVAGVLAHELGHVVLRHGTAQATKGQPFQLGALAGQLLGSLIGGRPGV